MKIKITRFLITTFAVTLMFGTGISAKAAMADNTNIKLHTHNGLTYWTMEQTLSTVMKVPTYQQGIEAADKVPYWYEEGTTFNTGIASSLRSLIEGEHYYSAKRSGEIPVGKVEVAWKQGRDIHDSFLDETGRLL